MLRRGLHPRQTAATSASTSATADHRKENGGVSRGNTGGGRGEAYEEESEESEGWGAGGVHSSEYLAAAATNTRGSVSLAAGRAASPPAVPTEAARGGTLGPPPPADRATDKSPPAPPFTPAATPAAEGQHGGSGDFACPSVRIHSLWRAFALAPLSLCSLSPWSGLPFGAAPSRPVCLLIYKVLLEHRHLSLRLRMQLTRLHTLSRTLTTVASTSHRRGASPLLARFSHPGHAPPPRRLPDALAEELVQLAPLVRGNNAV